MIERGATEEEAVAAVEGGEPFPAKYDRSGFRRNFTFTAVFHVFWNTQTNEKVFSMLYAVPSPIDG
jgi:hypothetical protein